MKRICDVVMICLFFAFFAFRINIARLNLSNAPQSQVRFATAFAFAIWGVADLIVLGLLVWNVIDHVQKSKDELRSNVMRTLLKSSVPRMAIIFLNTLSFVIVSFITPQSETVQNINQFNFMVKGAYPLILLLDILMTKSMLIDLRDKASGGSQMASTGSNEPLTRGDSNKGYRDLEGTQVRR
ncbi:hypothetical protein HDU76_013104 [Blyttiomyces sp. JEL0837]|nr:hypothetical protein HDU76_013104 [Blyttiomyces sp. JEL0837]